MTQLPAERGAQSRREFLLRSGGGCGALALTCLLGGAAQGAPGIVSPPAPEPPRVPAKAKSVMFLFMEGGPSHIDLFDYKPKLNSMAGKPIPASVQKVITAMGEYGSPILECRRTWKQYGQGG